MAAKPVQIAARSHLPNLRTAKKILEQLFVLNMSTAAINSNSIKIHVDIASIADAIKDASNHLVEFDGIHTATRKHQRIRLV